MRLAGVVRRFRCGDTWNGRWGTFRLVDVRLGMAGEASLCQYGAEGEVKQVRRVGLGTIG